MKAALAQYEVDIQMTADTIQALMENGYGLSVFKAAQVTISGAAPVVWSQTNQLTMTTSVTWQEQYQAYVSTSQIIPNSVIQATSTTDVGLGQTAQIDASGVMSITGGGAPSAISILNQTRQPWTCGVSQMVEGQANPVCAAPLYGNMLDLFGPVEQVLLIFSPTPINPGTVVYKAYAQGVLIDLSGAPQRTVQFDINAGWSWDGGSWGRAVHANDDLVPLLIQRQAV